MAYPYLPIIWLIFNPQILVKSYRSLPWKKCHEGRSYDFFVEAKSAAGVGPASRSMALTAFAASKPSVPQEFDVDLQSLSKGWGVPKISTWATWLVVFVYNFGFHPNCWVCVFFVYQKYQPGRPTDLLVVFFGG